MVIVVAMDSYKGSLSAVDAVKSVASGISEEIACDIIEAPMADGGEGTVSAMVSALAGKYIHATVKNPLGIDIRASYGVINEDTAVIEMASASGITLIKKEQLNPLVTTSFGTGQLIADALDRGYTNIILGIGGSATNDGGAGMAQALGVRFSDAQGNEVPFGGESLLKIQSIDMSNLHPKLKNARITAACDVTNPLCGEEGASNVFGRQKGADDNMVDLLDKALYHLALKIEQYLHLDVLSLSGGGAAGGLGAGIAAFCGGSLQSGFDIIAGAMRLKEKIAGADLVITGEGRTDEQTAFGKLPCGVGNIAKKYNVPCVILSGAVEGDMTKLYENGITAAFATVTSFVPLEEAMANAQYYLKRAAKNIIRMIKK